jgi:hypothetical protein
MTVLSVAQEVCRVIGLTVPEALVSNTNREYIEIAEIMQEMAQRITEGHDWQKLAKVATVTGNGSAESFSLPSDYKRMLVKASVWSSSLETALSPISDLDRWLELDVQTFDFVINAWTIYDNQFHIKPALGTGVTAKYFYVSENVFQAENDGDLKAEFNADTDVFLLNEGMLKLGAIYRWKQLKGLPYAEDMADYEERKARLIRADKGSRLMRMGRVRMPSDVTTAYPQTIDPS